MLIISWCLRWTVIYGRSPVFFLPIYALPSPFPLTKAKLYRLKLKYIIIFLLIQLFTRRLAAQKKSAPLNAQQQFESTRLRGLCRLHAGYNKICSTGGRVVIETVDGRPNLGKIERSGKTFEQYVLRKLFPGIT